MSIWDQFPNYSTDELNLLTAVAAETLADSAGSQIGADVLRISPMAAARELEPILREQNPNVNREAIQEILEDRDQGSKIALRVLDEIRQTPALAEKVAEEYENRRHAMAVPLLLLLVAPVVILAMRVKSFRVKVGKNEASGTFEKSGEEVKTFVSGLVSSATGLVP
jgi:hypothetical protein